MIPIKQWLTQKSNWMCLCSGALLGVSALGLGLWPLAWVGLIPALWQLPQCASWKTAWRQGLIVGLVYHGILFSWFFGMHPVTWMGFSSGMSVLITLLGWMIVTGMEGVFISLIWVGFYGLWKKHLWVLLMVGPVLWTGLLWLFNMQPLGQPWGFLTYTQAGMESIRGSLYTVGFWGLESLIIQVNLFLFASLFKRQAGFALSAVAVFALCVLLGHWWPAPPSAALSELQPLGIQGNIPLEAERLYLTETDKRRYYQQLIDEGGLSSVPNPGLMILPEGILRADSPADPNPFTLPEASGLLSGAVFNTPAGYYNGALLFIPGRPNQFMGKRILVPFGETMPFIPAWVLEQSLRHVGIHYRLGFSAAPQNQALLRFERDSIGVFICFEALYPTLSRYYQTHNADILITLSNLGWYHNHPLLARQFVAINQVRAAESGLPLVLVTNTGISAIISERGRVLSESPNGKQAFLRLPK